MSQIHALKDHLKQVCNPVQSYQTSKRRSHEWSNVSTILVDWPENLKVYQSKEEKKCVLHGGATQPPCIVWVDLWEESSMDIIILKVRHWISQKTQILKFWSNLFFPCKIKKKFSVTKHNSISNVLISSKLNRSCH